MFKSFLKSAFRNLWRNKSISIINTTGLSIGIAVCILIFMIIDFHSTYDQFHTRKKQIYRVLTEYHHSDSKEIFYGHGVPYGFVEGIRANFKEAEQIAPLLADHDDQIVLPQYNHGSETKKFKEENGVYFTTPSFFKIFDFPLLAGSNESLNDPNSVLLTRSTAEKYFGTWSNAMGKVIKLNNTDFLKVTGILENPPINTDFQFKAVIAFGTGFTKKIKNSTNYDGTNESFGCFILLPKQISVSQFNRELISYSKKVKSAENKDVQIIQPLSEVHYDVKTGNFGNKSISHKMIDILYILASFILLIACVNFINLSTAQAVNRSKEVGVRKVLGSNQWQIRLQFIWETFLMVLFSMIMAYFFAWLSLPYINNLLDISLRFSINNLFSFILFSAILIITVTFLSGYYPSIILSRFNPISALKNKITNKNQGLSLRKSLVVFQFIIAQSLIIGTLVLLKQLNYFTTQNIGFDKNQIVNIPIPTDSTAIMKLDNLKSQLKTVPGIQYVSFNSNTPVEDNNDNWTNFYYNHGLKQTEFYSIIKSADSDYVPTYKLPLIEGRNLGSSDTMKEILVNVLLLKNLGIKNPEEALNKEMSFDDRHKGVIVGVLKDFNSRPFRDDMAPIIITSSKKDYSQASFKIQAGNLHEVMHKIENIWNHTFPEFVFEYKFLDEKVQSFYKQENQLASIYKIFSFISILLCCLGLYGLSSYMAIQRVKEVGIRKVLGASFINIIYLFSREFLILVCIAFLIASPIVWYFMHQWLMNYAFRIEPGLPIFILGAAISVLIAMVSISFQSVRAAITNPVKNLRSE